MTTHANRPPTLKTVAELTGLSQSTVSLCLRGGSSVKASTREKVERVAREVGYVPNRAGVRLRTGKTNVLALVLAADKNYVDFTRQLIQGIGAEIEGSPFHLNVIPEFNRSEPTAVVRYILETRSADGVILTHTSARDPRVQLLMDAGLPFVCHGRTEFYAPHPFADFDAAGFVDVAVKRLAERGRKRLLLAAPDNGTTHYATLLNSFRRAVADCGLIGETAADPSAMNSASEARKYAETLTDLEPGYDGIITNIELIALALAGGLRDAGLKLGQDYDLICKQNTELVPALFPRMEAVREDLLTTGRELAALLIRRLAGEPAEALQSLQAPDPTWRATP